MEIKSFYKNQRELAETLSKVIDKYWSSEIPENEMIDTVIRIVENNKSKVFTDNTGEFTTVLRQQCGKRRLEVVSKILHNKG
ncbi:MAG: hypothetical protein HPY66_0742 [Firmicutes bacterium]|nr:hypothetical protein [Bacillota bacterium]MDI6705677.1 TIGR04540 family protein [Bacillota bacterium]